MSTEAQNNGSAAQSGAAPGQNPASQASHMPPPPLPPVIIPQNTNPIPTAITSPMSVSGVASPTSGGGFVRRAAPEPNKRALYVGGLDPRVTEDVLKQIFETTGHVQSVKIIPDKNVRDHASMQNIATNTPNQQAKGYNYGFVEYDDPGAAARAMETLNGRRVHQSVCAELKCIPNKAYSDVHTCNRKSASTGLTRATSRIRRILVITSISLSVTSQTKSTTRCSCRLSLRLAQFLKPV